MASFFFLVLIAGMGVALYFTRQDVKRIRRRLDELESRGLSSSASGAAIAPVEQRQPGFRVAAKVSGQQSASGDSPSAERQILSASAYKTSDRVKTSRFAQLSFENLVGGKLPIWVGGISLVFAGFFLVRYTIEAGLFGPGARSITATFFAFAMITLSELGGRLPKIGDSFTADPRVGQSLAGAGVATLYGTLYMAAEIYGLVGLPTAFVLVVVATAIAFALALRHGPPTALMGLTGGFAAPWAAGMGANSLPSLLLYLAVFIAALFGLAVWRRWLWLLVLASGGGALWSMAMLATAQSSLSLLGGFIAISGAGALIAAKRFTENKQGWSEAARYLPMALALVQLAILLPKIDFSVIGWLFYFALSGISIVLAWYDKRLVPLVAGALVLATGPLSGMWTEYGASTPTLAMTLAVAALFGAAGHIRARTTSEGATWWALIGLAGPVLCWFVAVASHEGVSSDRVWSATALIAAIPSAVMAWEWHRKGRQGSVQGWATATTALMVWVAGMTVLDGDYWSSHSAIVAIAVAAWAKVTGGTIERRISVLPLTFAIIAGAISSYQLIAALSMSLSGERAFYDSLPAIRSALRTTLVPSILVLCISWHRLFAAGRRTRAIALATGGLGMATFVWLIAKQAAAISTPSDFIRLGFAERAVFTQIVFSLAWLMLSQARLRGLPSLASAGWVLAGIAIFRFMWFDLLLLNPVMVPQAVGPMPIANLLTMHLALVAFWLWTLSKQAPPRFTLTVQGLSLGTMIAGVLGTVRQAVQGNLISGAIIDTGENYLYSAGLLALAIIWLALGINHGFKLLRIAGLSLLTAVTFKVFLIDAAALTGILRILSFLFLGTALIGIGWAYGRLMSVDKAAKAG